MDSRVMIRLTGELREEIEAAAAEEHRSLSNMLRVLVEEALENREKEKDKENE